MEDSKNAHKRATVVKKGISDQDGRRRREEKSVSLRKDKKEEGLSKRRNLSEVAVVTETAMVPAADTPATPSSSKSATVADIPSLMQGLTGCDKEVQVQSLRLFRKLLSTEHNPPVRQCIECGALPLFVKCLERFDTPQLQFEAAWALTNIASTDQTRVVVESGALPLLVQLLQSPNADIREQSAWCLGNIAGDGAEYRDIVLNLNAMEALTANVAHPANLSLLRNCTWALSNFCRGKPQPPMHIVAPALPVLANVLLQSTDQDTIIDATWALSYLSDGDNNRIQSVVNLGIIPALVSMLQSNKTQFIVPALRTLGNIVSGSDTQTQAVIDAGSVQALIPLLSHTKKNIRKEACWMISNVAAGTPLQLQQLMCIPDVVPKVLTQMASSSEWDVRKEASWVISNIATGGNRSHITYLVENGAVRHICDLMDVGEARMLIMAMDALDAILKVESERERVNRLVDEAGGIDKLETLQEHENEDVYSKAVSILEKYFGGDEEEEESENAMPTQGNQAAYSFGMSAPAQPAFTFGQQPAGANVFSFGQPAVAPKAAPATFSFGQQMTFPAL